MLVVAGVDIGAKNVHAVVLSEAQVLGKARIPSGFDHEQAAEEGLQRALEAAGASLGDLVALAATGAGRKALGRASEQPTEIAAGARGAYFLRPDVKTVVDIGADEARVIRLGEEGKILDFAVNDRCAAGTGAFVEAISRALELPVDEFGRLSLESTQVISMNAQCAVFAESEVVSLIHANTPPADIARAVHDAMAARVSTLVRRVGLEEPVLLGGGVALNVGFVKALREALGGVEVLVPECAEYLGALGAALIAWDAYREQQRMR